MKIIIRDNHETECQDNLIQAANYCTVKIEFTKRGLAPLIGVSEADVKEERILEACRNAISNLPGLELEPDLTVSAVNNNSFCYRARCGIIQQGAHIFEAISESYVSALLQAISLGIAFCQQQNNDKQNLAA